MDKTEQPVHKVQKDWNWRRWTDGADGNGIATIVNNGDNTITMTLDDGQTTTYTTGQHGPDGVNGTNGVTEQPDHRRTQGIPGADGGATGAPGDGADGNGIATDSCRWGNTITITLDDGQSTWRRWCWCKMEQTGQDGVDGLPGTNGADGQD